MGLIGRQLLHTNPTMQRDTGLRVLKETTTQVGLRGQQVERRQERLSSLDLRHFGDERGGSDQIKERWSKYGREGMESIIPHLDSTCEASPTHRRGTSSNQV